MIKFYLSAVAITLLVGCGDNAFESFAKEEEKSIEDNIPGMENFI